MDDEFRKGLAALTGAAAAALAVGCTLPHCSPGRTVAHGMIAGGVAALVTIALTGRSR